MVNIGKAITDYTPLEQGAEGDVLNGDALDEDMGVAVEFEGEDDDEEGGDADEIVVRDLIKFRCNIYNVMEGVCPKVIFETLPYSVCSLSKKV